MISYFIVLLLCIALAGNIVGSLKEKPLYISVAKPLLIPLILVFYLLNSTLYEPLLICGLLLGWIGDIFLIKAEGKRFISGLISFLSGHIFYIFLFLFRINFFKGISPYFFFFILLYLFLTIPVFLSLNTYLGEMKIPVIIYMSCIVIMSFTALSYIHISKSYDFWFTFFGSLLFLVSDFLLAYSTFRKKTKYSYSAVITTYVLAQLTITMGFLL